MSIEAGGIAIRERGETTSLCSTEEPKGSTARAETAYPEGRPDRIITTALYALAKVSCASLQNDLREVQYLVMTQVRKDNGLR